MYRRFFKRLTDVLFSIIALIVLSPLIILIALLVRAKLGSPIVFKQDRPGLNEKIFTMYKFKTMTDERDENGELLSDKTRLTGFGKQLRSTSLDELPELFNILKGDMSIIGPRPLLINYLPLYNNRQKRRHEVRPGLSGLAQINGRNDISWQDKFDLDIQYVENISFLLDCKIIINTIVKVFIRDGVSKAGNATTDPFLGSVIEEKIKHEAIKNDEDIYSGG